MRILLKFIPLKFKSFGCCQSKGMSLVEMMIAMAMLITFMSIVVTAFSFIGRFLQGSEVSLADSKGQAIDEHLLQVNMDILVETLAQPGFLLDDMQVMINSGCSYDPIRQWKLPGPVVKLVSGYKVCLSTTPASESIGEPGIYLLKAVPDEISASMLPTRRLFCRPQTMC